MTTQSRVFDPRQGRTRSIVVLPFALITVVAVILSLASLTAWGSADEVGYPSWLPTFGGVVVSLPILALAPLLGWLTWRRTSLPFRLAVGYLVPALVILGACCGLILIYAATIADAASYRSDTPDPITGAFKPLFEADTFRSASILLAVFFTVFLLVLPSRFLYWSAFPPARRDDVEGPDPMGEIMKSPQA